MGHRQGYRVPEQMAVQRKVSRALLKIKERSGQRWPNNLRAGFPRSGKDGEVGNHHTDGQAEEAVNLTHPLGVALGEIVVDGDDMRALARQRIEIGSERRVME